MAIVQIIKISKSAFLISLVLVSVFNSIAESYRTPAEYKCINDASSCRDREIPDLSRTYTYLGFLRLLERKSIAELCGNTDRYFKCEAQILHSEACRDFDGLNNMRSMAANYQAFSAAFCSDIPGLEEHKPCVTQPPELFFEIVKCANFNLDLDNCQMLEKFWNCLQDVTREPCGEPVVNFIKATWDRYNELQPKCLGNAAKGEYSGILEHLKAINKNFA